MSYKISKDISYRMLENDVVILNLKNGYYYVLNKTASELWDLLIAHKLTVEKVISNFMHKYEIDRETAMKDIDDQMRYWSQEKIIES